jgi:hypothetical protein
LASSLYCHYEGTVPTEIGLLESLEVLHLSKNSFNVSISIDWIPKEILNLCADNRSNAIQFAGKHANRDWLVVVAGVLGCRDE